MEDFIKVLLYILKGMGFTLRLYGVTFAVSIPLGLVFSLGKISKYRIPRYAMEVYTWFFRGTPLLLQLFFTYYALPLIGIRFQPFTAAALTFSLNYAAYFTEIFRAGVQSIDKGQSEAAKVLGMGYWQSMIYIIIPQAFKRVIPPVCSEAINLIKDTALIAAIGSQDLLRSAKEIVTRDFTIYPFFIVTTIYLLLTFVVVTLFKNLEKRYSVYE